jgi:glycosyltransferase involved in cell wall biosynthesis
MLGRALVKAGWGVRVLGFRSKQYDGPDVQDDEGVQIYRLPLPQHDFRDVRAITALYRTVRKWARAGEIDLFELPDAEGWAAGWPPLPIPVVSRVHGSSTYFGKELGRTINRGNYWRERLSMRRSDAWCAVSRYSGDKTQEIFRLPPPGAISYVPVVMPEPVEAATRLSHRVVYTGTLTPKKGIERLVEAWPEILRRVPEARLDVYGKDTRRGSPSMTDTLLGRMDDASRASVTFYGHRARPVILEALRTASVAVFPSYAEAFAFAPIEAMACGCPTVYSTRTSGPELVQNGENGLLIDPDQPAQIADAVVAVLTDPALAVRLGRNGRDRIGNNFTVEHLVPRIDSFYRKCIREFAAQRNGKTLPLHARDEEGR